MSSQNINSRSYNHFQLFPACVASARGEGSKASDQAARKRELGRENREGALATNGGGFSVTRPSVRVHWVACGTCSVPGNFFKLGGH